MCCLAESKWACEVVLLKFGNSYFQFNGSYKLALIALTVLELLLLCFIWVLFLLKRDLKKIVIQVM